MKRKEQERHQANGAREWTAEIVCVGQVVYAWFAYNPKFDTFATANLKHARCFKSEADVDNWCERLGVANATPVRIRDGKIQRKPVTLKGGL